MDVVIDTNIIIKEDFLRSSKFSALLDYLKKTNSHIILPQIVKEESSYHYKIKVTENLHKFNALSSIFFSPFTTEPNIDIEKEIEKYEISIQKLVTDGLLYEIPYEDYFLHDIVYRMINKKKPCNGKGQECRDTVLWLSIKKKLNAEVPVALISNNTNEFASPDKTDLHADLRTELDKEKLILKYYLNVSDFLKNHAGILDNITETWIKEKLSKIDIDSLIIDYFVMHDRFLRRLAESKSMINCINAVPTILFHELVNFYVYEMRTGDIYLNFTLYVDMLIKSEFEVGLTKIFNSSAYIEISAKIIDTEIKELEIDDVYQGKLAKSHKEKYGVTKNLIRDETGRIIDCDRIHPDCENDICLDCRILKSS